jgi:hypothetical protein
MGSTSRSFLRDDWCKQPKISKALAIGEARVDQVGVRHQSADARTVGIEVPENAPRRRRNIGQVRRANRLFSANRTAIQSAKPQGAVWVHGELSLQ